jgi:exocyst complex protein 7
VQNVSPTVRIYAEIRGSYLSASLQNLASASISTSKKKTPDEVYRGGTSGIGIYSGALNAMFGAEWQNVTQIFSRENCATVFEMTTRKALAEFARTLRELNSQIKANITTDCFLAYEILEIVSRLSSRLDDQTGQLKPQLTDAVKPIRETAKVSLSDLLDDVRRRIGSMTFFPVDAAALPYTTEVMTRVQTLITYPDALSSIMTSLGDGNWASAASGMNESSTSLSTTKSFDVGADGEKIRAHYVQDTMEIFLTSLDAKSKPMMKSRTVHGVFLANNIVVMDRMMRQSDIHKLLVTTKSQNKLDIWKKRAQASYLDCWREPCATLMDVQYTNRGARPPSGSSGSVDSAAIVKGLSSKDRDSVKEKFKHFNILFESCSAKHRELVGGMEREVRSQVAREIQTMIEPLYARYWDRYHEVDKGKGKYVKYDKPALSAALTSLG